MPDTRRAVDARRPGPPAPACSLPVARPLRLCCPSIACPFLTRSLMVCTRSMPSAPSDGKARLTSKHTLLQAELRYGSILENRFSEAVKAFYSQLVGKVLSGLTLEDPGGPLYRLRPAQALPAARFRSCGATSTTAVGIHREGSCFPLRSGDSPRQRCPWRSSVVTPRSATIKLTSLVPVGIVPHNAGVDANWTRGWMMNDADACSHCASKPHAVSFPS